MRIRNGTLAVLPHVRGIAIVPATYRRLADLEPTTLAVMHGSSYAGDCPGLLRALADVYEERYGCGSGAAPAF